METNSLSYDIVITIKTAGESTPKNFDQKKKLNRCEGIDTETDILHYRFEHHGQTIKRKISNSQL